MIVGIDEEGGLTVDVRLWERGIVLVEVKICM